MMAVIWPNGALIFGKAEPIIKQAEGLRLKAYLCPAKVWTLGWGCTQHPNGQPVTADDFLHDEAEAEVYLQASETRILLKLEASGAVTRAPTVNQAAALLSLAYNIGVGVHDGVKGDLADSSLLQAFDRGDIHGAALHFLDWDKARVDGAFVVLPGLKTRRTTEMNLFLEAA